MPCVIVAVVVYEKLEVLHVTEKAKKKGDSNQMENLSNGVGLGLQD
jgi:hypothetical protein